MANIFFISDTHFGHDNMYKFVNWDGTKCRPIADNAQEGDEIIIQRWNEMVGPKDKVYHLGDVAMKSGNIDQVMQRLNGQKVLIKGNHDKFQLGWYMKYFKDIRGTVHIDGNYLLSHFPIHPDSKGKFVRGLHGHIHNQTVYKDIETSPLVVKPQIVREPDLWYRNCCVEANDFRPIPFEVIKQETQKLIDDGIIVIPQRY